MIDLRTKHQIMYKITVCECMINDCDFYSLYVVLPCQPTV